MFENVVNLKFGSIEVLDEKEAFQKGGIEGIGSLRLTVSIVGFCFWALRW